MRASPRPAVLVVALLLAACGGSVASPDGATPGAAATPTEGPSPTVAAPTSLPATTPNPATPAPTTASTPVAAVTPTSAPTVAPTPAPTPRPPAAPTPKPTPKPTVKPTPRPVAVTVALAAVDFAFEPSALSITAGTAFRIAFSNEDVGIPHNVAIRTEAGAQVFSGAIVTGATNVTYAVAALPAGSYALACIVHPTMTGSLTVN